MRSARRIAAICGALAMAAGLMVTLATSASAADSTTYLGGVIGKGDVAVGGGKVFVSASDRIVVADTNGALTGAVTGLSNAQDLVVTPDGARLYAALSGSDEVAEIDTATLAVTRRFDVAAHRCPQHLSLSGARLWVGYGCNTPGAWENGAYSLDLSATAPQPAAPVKHGVGAAPLVAAAGDTLVVGTTGTTSSDLLMFDVGGDNPTPRGTLDGFTSGLAFLEELAITPDGSTVITVARAESRLEAWDTTSLTAVRAYTDAQGDAVAVALSPDGARLAGGWASSASKPRVTVHDAATAQQTNAYEDTTREPVYASVAFSGSDLFAVQRERKTGRLYLWRVHGAALPASAVRLTPPAEAKALEPLTITGQLTTNGLSAPGAQPLVVTRQPPRGAIVTLPTATTKADGTFTITDTPPIGGWTTYQVLWDGDAGFRWSSASVRVFVSRREWTLTLTGPDVGTVGQPLQFSGTLSNVDPVSPAGVPLSVRRAVFTPDGSYYTELPKLTTGADGSFSFSDTPVESGPQTYIVTKAEDNVYLPAQASHDVNVQAATQ
ncbi:hypothetical protein AB0L53_05380 [Nonomuraea sp. NPDC052129]|uniref:hypothetical protein n=1 Tax=Nonomuraea sp. NPDC052129 TaxID=3154651 RepID=UPI0034282D25